MKNSTDEGFFSCSCCCKILSLYTKSNLSMVLRNIHGKFSISLKFIANNTFSEPQPDSALQLGEIIFLDFF